VSETDREAEHHRRLFDQLRAGLLDLSPSDPMLDYRHRVASRRQVRIVDCDLEQVFMELAGRRGELALVALPEAEDVPDDERLPRFLGALARARATDFDYLTKLASLDALGWQDDAAHAEVERWLRDHVRTQIGLPPHPNRAAQDIAAQARARGIAPGYDLAPLPGEQPPVPTALQTLFVADELDVRLARIAADAALAEQETGLSTLFMAFGFVRWYPSAESEAARLAPLLLLPVTLSRRMEEARAIYAVRAVAESPVLSPSLREWFVQAGAPALPEFDPESDSIESYLSRIAQTIAALDRWQVVRNLTLGHFAFGRLAMYTDLAPEEWPDRPAAHPLVEALLRGSDAAAGEVAFAADYDVDDEEIEDAAPILIDDADAAQHSAVVDVMRGKNLVIEGAPGTGKSQTIANIVANALYAGKTVLVVANKRAALDAVKWRMDVAGLGDFCLELHSDRAQPKAILDRLSRRYDMGRDRGYEPAWAIDVRKLRHARSRVREYLDALHAAGAAGAPSAFAMFWPAIAARREYAREFAAVHRVDLSEIFAAPPQQIAAGADTLRLFGSAVESHEQNHGKFADTPWWRAGFAPAADCDEGLLAQSLRDAHEAATGLVATVAEQTPKLGVELPRTPTELAAWVEATRRLPPIPEDTLLPHVVSFAPAEVLAAADLAAAYLGLASDSADATPDADPAAVRDLAVAAEASGVIDALPAEVVARAGTMAGLEPSLREGFTKISSLITAFAPGSEATVGGARAMARTVEFAVTIPPHLDAFLGFDGTGHEELLSDGAQRVRLLKDTERTLDQKFRRNERGEWPSLDDLKMAATVASGTSLGPIARVTGGRKRANQVFQTLGVTVDTPDLQSDLAALIFHLEAHQRLRNDTRVVAAAGAFWAQAATPFVELETVTGVRTAFDALIADLGDIGTALKSHLFSSNPAIIAKLRSYQPWVAQFQSDLEAWPERFDAVPLRQAASHIEQRTAKLGQLADGIREPKLDEVAMSFAALRQGAQRRLDLADLEAKVATDPVLTSLGDATWRSPAGCEALRQAGSLAQAIADVHPPPGLRARLTGAEGASFALLLEESAAPITQAVERHRRDVARLAAVGGVRLDADGADPEHVASLLAALLPELPSLEAWFDVARRRAQAGAIGLEPLIAAFEEAGLPPSRLAGTFAALEVFYRAVLMRRDHPALTQRKGDDIEAEREHFAETDRAFQERQREAVGIKLLGHAIPSGSCAGRKKDWTELHYIRDQLARTEKHASVRTLLSKSRRAILAMTPCVMASPLSLATYLAPSGTSFDLVVIDEASQMRPEDALGSLRRARQAVIVGDRNALPPKDVFARVTPPEELGVEADQDDGGNGESFLDWALRAFPAPRRLATHYRSRCTSLVTFANREFYGGTLAVPPNVRRDAFSIDVVRAHGSYKAGRNAAEIVRIVAAAIDFMIRNAELPDKMQTLGIVAIGREQRDAICDEFSRMARLPVVETYLAACKLATDARAAEPFFIKDIENVAGDARDVIMISLTLAREFGQPRAMQRFGAISAPHGARRVNVLSTRARRRIVLFASMAADDIVVTPESGDGAQALADYLRYVEGRQAEIRPEIGAEHIDACRREIAARIEAHGFSTDLTAGAFGVDLAVRHPRDANLYLAGIAVDGPGFAGVRSGRERDRLRDAVLSAKGWTMLRAWSADWFASPQAQTAKLVEDLTRLAANPIEADRVHALPLKPTQAAAPPANASGGGETAAAEPVTP
jgi:RecA/RadA recombinase/very-short-patch-repair endonuclease